MTYINLNKGADMLSASAKFARAKTLLGNNKKDLTAEEGRALEEVAELWEILNPEKEKNVYETNHLVITLRSLYAEIFKATDMVGGKKFFKKAHEALKANSLARLTEGERQKFLQVLESMSDGLLSVLNRKRIKESTKSRLVVTPRTKGSH